MSREPIYDQPPPRVLPAWERHLSVSAQRQWRSRQREMFWFALRLWFTHIVLPMFGMMILLAIISTITTGKFLGFL